jgi:hypothetical protein
LQERAAAKPRVGLAEKAARELAACVDAVAVVLARSTTKKKQMTAR